MRHADDMLRHLPADLTQYVPFAFATKSPPYNVPTNDASHPPILIEVTKITGSQCVSDRVKQLLSCTKHVGTEFCASRLTWERELDLQALYHHTLDFSPNGPNNEHKEEVPSVIYQRSRQQDR